MQMISFVIQCQSMSYNPAGEVDVYVWYGKWSSKSCPGLIANNNNSRSHVHISNKNILIITIKADKRSDVLLRVLTVQLEADTVKPG